MPDPGPIQIAAEALERFWAKVDRRGPQDCWIWLASKDHKGYGFFWPTRERYVKAHRFAYEALVGPIPDGLQIDHLCRNPSCVNPTHLEPVTVRENSLRGISPASQNARKTHCPNGHPLEGDNLIVSRGSHEYRQCRTCRNKGQRERKRERVAQELPARRPRNWNPDQGLHHEWGIAVIGGSQPNPPLHIIRREDNREKTWCGGGDAFIGRNVTGRRCKRCLVLAWEEFVEYSELGTMPEDAWGNIIEREVRVA